MTAIQPNQTLWLMPGTYRNHLRLDQSNQTGITIASYDKYSPAVLDGYVAAPPRNQTIVTILVDNVTLKGLVLTNTITDPSALVMSYPDTQGGNPNARGAALDDRGNGTKIINCVVHDTGAGLGAWQNGGNQVYYGNIIFNNGTDAPDRLQGQGVYHQNEIGTKVFENNIIFNNFEANVQLSGSEVAHGRNITWRKNVFMNNILRFFVTDIRNLLFEGNHVWGTEPAFGAGAGISTYYDVTVRNNHLMGGVQLVDFVNSVTFTGNRVWNRYDNKLVIIYTSRTNKSQGFIINNNTYYKVENIQWPNLQFSVRSMAVQDDPETDFAYNANQTPASGYVPRRWVETLGFDQNGQYFDHIPQGVDVFIEPNQYDPDRFTVVVYNYGGAATAQVNLSPHLSPGDRYELRNVQDYFGDIVSGTYSGSSISLGMNRTRAKPRGYDGAPWIHDPLQDNTFPKLGVFVLIRKP